MRRWRLTVTELSRKQNAEGKPTIEFKVSPEAILRSPHGGFTGLAFPNKGTFEIWMLEDGKLILKENRVTWGVGF